MIPRIKPILIPFTHRMPKLKRLYNKGLIPIDVGIYGDKIEKGKPRFKQIVPENIATLEHIVPQSKGGTDELCNTALCSLRNNQKRGNKSILVVFSHKAFEEYLEKISKIKVEGLFDGEFYAENVRKLVYSMIQRGL